MQAYRSFFETPQGILILNDMMKKYGVLHTTFRGDVNEMLVREGERNVVLRILSILKIDINKLRERIEENAREE